MATAVQQLGLREVIKLQSVRRLWLAQALGIRNLFYANNDSLPSRFENIEMETLSEGNLKVPVPKRGIFLEAK
jgi:hypothetical protein